MSRFSILQISDTHLSPRTDHFRENNRLLAEPLAESDHDFIVHTGDVTLDGIRYDEDYALCRDSLRNPAKLSIFLRAIMTWATIQTFPSRKVKMAAPSMPRAMRDLQIILAPTAGLSTKANGESSV